MDAPIDAHRAVTLLSETLETPYVLIGPLAGGETGATAIERADGRRFVLKWELDPEDQTGRRTGVRLAERLRTEAGWPCPKQQVVEAGVCLLIVQEFLDGTTVTYLTHDIVDAVFDLHERRLRIAADVGPNQWGDDMIQLLVEGGNGYCLHEPLRTFDARTRRVVERIEEIGRSTMASDLDGGDIVHVDLHEGNLLQVDGRLCAVVDMDFTCVGDAAFDLVTLAIASLAVTADPGVRRRLFERGVDVLAEPKRRAYVANLLLRVLDWPIRKNRPSDIEFWLAQADRLLDG